MAKKKTVETVLATDQIGLVASTLAYETYKILKEQSKNVHLQEFAMSTYLSEIIADVLFNKMKEVPPGEYTDLEHYDFAAKRLVDTKNLIQDAVGRGVELALSQWSGMEVHYYCQIKPVPEPKNKPC